MSSVSVTPFFTLTDGRTGLAFAGQGDRYRKNLAAIRLLRQLQRDARTPQELTDAERFTLAHYTAFGDSALLRRAFGNEASDLDGLVSADEVATIKRTSLTAFYTSTDVLQAKWAALTPILEQLPGTITMLEPSVGIGNYIASMPLSLRARAQITAVELDRVSSQIATYLHPDMQLFAGQGFEEIDLPENAYDLVISNVPFGNDKVFDPRMPHDYLTRTIHDYFIARALLLVRPGGLIAVITSYGTLDKRDSRVRAWIAERAELISAVRLPQGAFNNNAGTACGADLLIFRRYADDIPPRPNPAWVETALAVVPIIDDDGGHYTNNSILSSGEFEERVDGTALLRMGRVFADQPAQVLGTTRVVRDGTRHFSHVAMPTDDTIGAALAQRLANLPQDLIAPRVEQQVPAARDAAAPRPEPSACGRAAGDLRCGQTSYPSGRA
jgi:hypothetical protein